MIYANTVVRRCSSCSRGFGEFESLSATAFIPGNRVQSVTKNLARIYLPFSFGAGIGHNPAVCCSHCNTNQKADRFRYCMSTNGSRTARVFVILLALILTPTMAAYAGGWGRGPSIAGYHPLDPQHPVVPAKPFDGAKQAIHDAPAAIGQFGTQAWNTVKRPFVETWKFLSDPLAGWKRKAQEAYNRAVADATALAYQIVKWLSVGFGTALAFSIGLAMGLAALLFRPGRHQHSHH